MTSGSDESIVVKSPTRIDFAGGTLDCWPLHCFVQDCVTINVSVDIYTHVKLTPHMSPKLEIGLEDLNYTKTFKSVDEFFNCQDAEIRLIQMVVRFFQPASGFQLTTKSESPMGGGLGGSSSLLISLMKAFAQWTDQKLTMTEAVEIAHNLEATLLKKPTGTQDYVPAWQPGLYAIGYGPRGMKPHRMDSSNISAEKLAERMTLVYTGQPHHSGLNNWQVLKHAIEGNTTTLEALHELRDVALATWTVLQRGELDELSRCFRRELECRLKLAEAFSSPEILRLEKIAHQVGSEALKICGAGGGGCVFVWSQPKKQKDVQRALESEGFQVLKARPVFL